MSAMPELTWMHFLVLGAVLLLVFQPWRWFASRRYRPRNVERLNDVNASEPAHAVDFPPPMWPRALVCIAIGAVVPIVVFIFALIATMQTRSEMPIPLVIWGVSPLVSAAGTRGGPSLAVTLLGSRDRVKPPPQAGKPAAFDPESFEVANGHR